MPRDFNEAFADEAAADVAALGGETITYTTAAGVASSIEAIVPREKMRIAREETGSGTDIVWAIGGVVILLADIAVPALGDKLTFDPTAVEGSSTRDFAITSIDSMFGGEASLSAEASATEERTAGKVRGGD